MATPNVCYYPCGHVKCILHFMNQPSIGNTSGLIAALLENRLMSPEIYDAIYSRHPQYRQYLTSYVKKSRNESQSPVFNNIIQALGTYSLSFRKCHERGGLNMLDFFRDTLRYVRGVECAVALDTLRSWVKVMLELSRRNTSHFDESIKFFTSLDKVLTDFKLPADLCR